MDASKVIIDLLGVQQVRIEDITLFPKSGRAEVELRFELPEYRCPQCGWKMTKLHDWQQRRMQGPPLGIFTHVILLVSFPRLHCIKCRAKRSVPIPWQHPRCSSVTCGLAEIAGRMMEETTCEAASRLLHGNSRTFWELDQFRMQLLFERMNIPPSVNLSYLSADEVHFRTLWVGRRKGPFARQWEPQFVTNLVSYFDGKVLFNGLGRGSEALETALSILTPEQKLSVRKFGLDMHDGFISVAQRQCPNAEICIDRFHLIQQVNQAFDKVRREEFKRARKKKMTFLEGMLAPSRRFILVERYRKRSKLEHKMLKQLRDLNDNIHSAMLLVESLHSALDKTRVSCFRKALGQWYCLVRESNLKPFKTLAKTIAKYRHHIEAYISSRLTTAVSEGLNNKIKTLKRMAYGYTNPISFRNKILQRCGYLNHYHINTQNLFLKIPNNAAKPQL
jgi:transposase